MKKVDFQDYIKQYLLFPTGGRDLDWNDLLIDNTLSNMMRGNAYNDAVKKVFMQVILDDIDILKITEREYEFLLSYFDLPIDWDRKIWGIKFERKL